MGYGKENRADGFANATVKDKNGKERKLRKGIVLEDQYLVERSILNRARAAAEKGETFTFTAECTVHLCVDVDEAEDVPF